MRRYRDPQEAIELKCPVCEEYVNEHPNDRFEDTDYTEEPCDECQEKEEQDES